MSQKFVTFLTAEFVEKLLITPHSKDPDLRKLMRLSLPLILGTAPTGKAPNKHQSPAC